jgi:hypothetical protein
MWPFKKKSDRQILTDDIQWFRIRMSNNEYEVRQYERQLARALKIREECQSAIRMGEKTLLDMDRVEKLEQEQEKFNSRYA